MIGDVVAWIALHALDGWLLAGVWLLWSLLMLAVGSRLRVWVDDRRRARVQAALDRVTAENIAGLVPGQRRERD